MFFKLLVTLLLSENIKEKLNKCDSEILDKACEIRIRTGCPIIISSYKNEFISQDGPEPGLHSC